MQSHYAEQFQQALVKCINKLVLDRNMDGSCVGILLAFHVFIGGSWFSMCCMPLLGLSNLSSSSSTSLSSTFAFFI